MLNICLGFSHHVKGAISSSSAFCFSMKLYVIHWKRPAELYCIMDILVSVGPMCMLLCSMMAEGMKIIECGGNLMVIPKSHRMM